MLATVRSFVPVLGLALVVAYPLRAAAQSNDDCLTCHSDTALTTKHAGKTISLYVDQTRFAASIHGKRSCIDCHTDQKGKEFPHEQTPKPVACGSCHALTQRQFTASVHGKAVERGNQLAPGCIDCHGSHEIVAATSARSPVRPLRVASLCGSCHSEGGKVHQQLASTNSSLASGYSDGIHNAARTSKGRAAATCVSCHTAHSILASKDPKSSVAATNVAATCSRCHSQLTPVHNGFTEARPGKETQSRPACIICHEPHKGTVAATRDLPLGDKDCLVCHRQGGVKTFSGRPLHVDTLALAGSVHGGQACSQCHVGVTRSHTKGGGAPVQKVNCASCHGDVAAEYQKSTHGQLEAKHNSNAPSCKQCHGTHAILSKTNPKSPTFATRIPTLCAQCHRTGQKAAVLYTGPETKIVEGYTESIHGKGLIESGLVVAATCTSCHTAHSVLPRDSSKSSVNRNNVAATCGACHVGIEEKFARSVHSPSVTSTTRKLPVCDDCHTAHTISRTDAQGFKLRIMGQCGGCHAAIAETYFDTYHGKVSRLGYTKTAQCYDCHGSHDILRVKDPRSHLSSVNVVNTCKKCHAGANARFAGFLTHATHDDPAKYPILFWVFWAMTALLVGTFTVAGGHTLLWLPRALQMRAEFGRYPAAAERELVYQRFSILNRVLHVTMIVSFIALALTGLSLKFSYTGWASVLSHLLGGFETAGFIHRTAAVAMVSVFVAHITDVLKRKHQEHTSWKDLIFGPNSMMFNRKDLSDFVGSVKWFLGRGERPRYGRWTYWEKFDYFAVFWGIAVIGSTGLLLWFPTVFSWILPGWSVNVATIIHSDEALLATGFIFTIHFFNTHLRPEKFPMDIVIFTGRMTVEELEHDKPAEFEELVAKNELAKHLVEPYQPIVIRTVRAFGWTALTVGFLIVLWIVYAMLFA